ncbi:cache domain-containing protein [Streptomyces sp. FXJ1.172]|uniref:cache domain-containing protein n=1 Tax=Streptomyces sp. FXJ1.172 TaxID=710705 RepID=UPI0007CF8205|nr:cache domain-containing protein [Streptomyces sp. FXJ1.172]WEO93588.1 cache domain-containing protein [Streptomyces sp. FXJ1.172]
MGWSPALATLDTDPQTWVAAQAGGALEAVFATVAAIRAETAALLHRVTAQDRRPASADLAALRPGLHGHLTREDLVSGAGFVAAPGLLSDVPAWLEWWQSGGEGEIRPLLLDLDPGQSAYADYTHWDWFALPRDTGRRAVAGPYVDYLCSDEYSLTLSEPVRIRGRFAGVAAADVYLRHFETAVLPLLRRLDRPAHLVNARGRVAASADPAHLAGSLTKGPEFGALLTGGRPGTYDGMRLVPCGGVPLVLVLA